MFINYNQQDATFLDLFISTDSLHVSGRASAHHQEHRTVHTASGIVNQYCRCRGWEGTPFYLIQDNSKMQHWLTIPEVVCKMMCSWWWAEEPPETCRASVEINKSKNVASCWLQFGNIFAMRGHMNVKFIFMFSLRHKMSNNFYLFSTYRLFLLMAARCVLWDLLTESLR